MLREMTVRKGIVWAIEIILLALLIKAGMWAYQHYGAGGKAQRQEVLDVDKDCKVIPDTGQCFCRHRWTNERLTVPYRECVSLARRP